MNPPELMRTERLLLRRVRPDDRAAAVEIHTDPATNVHRAQGAVTAEQAVGLLDRWIGQWDSDGIGYWAIHNADEEVIGFGGLALSEEEGEEVLNLYYRFRPNAWGHGYAPEMATAAVDWARRERPDRCVVIVTRPLNAPSLRVADKLGFVRYAERAWKGFDEWLFRDPVTTRS